MQSRETSVVGHDAQVIPLSVRTGSPPALGESLTRLSEQFLRSQDIKKSSKTTYRRCLRRFIRWVSKAGVWGPTREDILTYKNNLIGAGLSSATVSAYLVVVRRFFEWLEGMKLYPNVAKGIKGGKRPRGFRKDPLTVDQVLKLLRSVCRDDLTGKRDFALLNLLIRTGIRSIEARRANIGDIRQNTGETVLWVEGKGRDSKDEFVVLTQNALKPITEYLQELGEKSESAPLFASLSNRNRDERLTTQSIAAIVRSYLQRIGVSSNRITPHSLRHTAITLSLIAGASIQEARALGRHSDINTTLTYAHNIDRIARAPERKIDELLGEAER